MEQKKCQYGLTLEQCKNKYEAPCQNEDHICDFLKNIRHGGYIKS